MNLVNHVDNLEHITNSSLLVTVMTWMNSDWSRDILATHMPVSSTVWIVSAPEAAWLTVTFALATSVLHVKLGAFYEGSSARVFSIFFLAIASIPARGSIIDYAPSGNIVTISIIICCRKGNSWYEDREGDVQGHLLHYSVAWYMRYWIS